MAYKILGYVVWNGGKLYLRHRFATRRLLAAGVVGLGVAGLTVLANRRNSGGV
jgi:hypothetical protein